MQISVIIPAYNSEKTIASAIRSVIDQTYPVSEIIIIDDGSTDNTRQEVLSIDDPRIIYQKQPENKGASAARNTGVFQAKHDMIAFHDSDDIWCPEKTEKQVSYIESHENCRFVYSQYVRHYSSSDLIVPDTNCGIRLEGSILPELLYQNSIGTDTILMNRQLFLDIGGFDEKLRCLEDWDLVIRVAKCCSIGFIPEVLVEAAESNPIYGVTSNIDRYYESRCQMIRKYKTDYLSTKTFDNTVASILQMAFENNMLDSVKEMLLECIVS